MIIVGMAAAFGVLRFGVSEKFTGVNQDLATMSKFVGLPLVGLEFGHKAMYGSTTPLDLVLMDFFGLVMLEAITRSLIKDREGLSVLFNLAFVISPIGYFAFVKNDFYTLLALVGFIVGAVGIGASFEKRIAGIRRVDWFHYIIGTTWFVLACRLVSL